MFKLVAIDLDGTLLNKFKKLSTQNVETIKQAARRGTKIVISTARDPLYVRAISRQLEINDPIICTNGAQVWGSLNGPVWANLTIPSHVAFAIAKLADQNNWHLTTTVESTTYWHHGDKRAERKSPNCRQMVNRNVDGIVGEPVRIMTHSPNAIIGIHNLCNAHYGDQIRTEIFYEIDGTPHSLAVFSPEADKGHALQTVCQQLNIDMRYTLAIGDNMNDLSMLNTAGAFVAMGNAAAPIRRKANAIAPDNNHDGVAWAIQKYVLK